MLCKKVTILLLLCASLFLFSSCISSNSAGGLIQESPTTEVENEKVLGYGILRRIPGLWHGPVTTDTPAGNFPVWYVDFRNVLPGQVSQYTSINPQMLNYLTFFIVKHDGRLKVAMRTEGVLQNKGCVTYEIIDKVKESEGYYRFSDFQSGIKRAYTEFFFKPDKFVMKVYTNKFNNVSPLELHAEWKARLGDRKAALEAITHFKAPQPIMAKDFTNVFQNMSESIYYTFEKDPYPATTQPYVGTLTVYISIDKKLKVTNNHELFLMLTTKSLFEGLEYKKENLKYVSRFIFLPIGTRKYTFRNVHPGTYYLYSYNDINGDKLHRSNDYMSSKFEYKVIIKPKENTMTDTHIDFVIP